MAATEIIRGLAPPGAPIASEGPVAFGSEGPVAVGSGGARSGMIGAMPEEQTRPDDQAHDVLAAEEFGVPAPDPALHHGPVSLPQDPTGIAEPHDVLAAEEFAMPAPRPGAAGDEAGQRERRRRGGFAVAGTLALIVALASRKRSR